MRRFSWFLSVLIVLSFPSPVLAASPSAGNVDPLFKKLNVDVDKYDFTKNFILSVSYYKRVSDRLKIEEDLKAKRSSDLKMIRKYIKDRTLDNTELRIARNYLTRFTSSANGLIQKVSRQAIQAYDTVLALTIRERRLWEELYQFKSTGNPEDFNEEGWAGRQLAVFAEKKEADKSLLETSMLIRKVLLSAELCPSEDCKILVLTRSERRKLTGYLDDFARDNLEWGIKAGQSPVEGCVAAVREVLEDQAFISKEDK